MNCWVRKRSATLSPRKGIPPHAEQIDLASAIRRQGAILGDATDESFVPGGRASTGVNPSEGPNAFPKNHAFARGGTGTGGSGPRQLTAAWVAHVRREEGALPEQLYRSRREDTPVPSPSAEEAEVVQIDADARNSEEKSGPKV